MDEETRFALDAIAQRELGKALHEIEPDTITLDQLFEQAFNAAQLLPKKQPKGILTEARCAALEKRLMTFCVDGDFDTLCAMPQDEMALLMEFMTALLTFYQTGIAGGVRSTHKTLKVPSDQGSLAVLFAMEFLHSRTPQKIAHELWPEWFQHKN